MKRGLYWTGTAIAGFTVTVVLTSYAFNVGKGFPVISAAALVLAGTIWLAGWVCSHVYAGR